MQENERGGDGTEIPGVTFDDQRGVTFHDRSHHTDDTTMPTIDRGRATSGRGKRNVFTGRLWPYLGRSGAPWDLAGAYVVFRYSESRGGKHVRDCLVDWEGGDQFTFGLSQSYRG